MYVDRFRRHRSHTDDMEVVCVVADDVHTVRSDSMDVSRSEQREEQRER